MHLWGQNIGKQPWAAYIRQLKSAIKNAQQQLQYGSTDGNFYAFSSGRTPRSVDWIDFCLYLMPTLLAEALVIQKKIDVVDTINKRNARPKSNSSHQLANADDDSLENQFDFGRISVHNYSLTPKWHAFLLKRLGKNVFTINQHYMLHVTEAIRQLSSLKLISARPMERQIGTVKRLSKSRSKPGENSVTVVKDLCYNACKRWNEQVITSPVGIVLEPIEGLQKHIGDELFLDLLKNVHLAFASLQQMPTIADTVEIIHTYFITTNSQTIKSKSGNKKAKVMIKGVGEVGCGIADIDTIFSTLSKKGVGVGIAILDDAAISSCKLFASGDENVCTNKREYKTADVLNYLELIFNATHSFHYTNVDIKEGKPSFNSLFVYLFLEAIAAFLADSIH
ncbi:uncharacterized protein EV154DRAFT_559347 [Mucor mucedo]|uniref:uncharacterized protein n=1 Tax=Mucor mucedo TaxID=29922 RepID=UPI00221FE4F7|nr:uncharacterized protein EV154DRAFT_559347 [Mucor mucedo]KAI7895589.1 hypothetical protein EV154DRAFT_559347 [Mucor mucedo]